MLLGKVENIGLDTVDLKVDKDSFEVLVCESLIEELNKNKVGKGSTLGVRGVITPVGLEVNRITLFNDGWELTDNVFSVRKEITKFIDK
jgi:hypothetical protein